MADNYEHDKPYSLTATFTDTDSPSLPITAPYDLHATFVDISMVIDAEIEIDTGFDVQAVCIYAPPGTVYATLNAEIDTSFLANADLAFDINFELGVVQDLRSKFEIGKTQGKAIDSAWDIAANQPVKADVLFEQGELIAKNLDVVFEQGYGIRNVLETKFEQAQPLRSYLLGLVWEEAERLRLFNDVVWQQGKNIAKSLLLEYQEALPADTSVLAKFEQAESTSELLTLDSDQGKSIAADYVIPYEEASAIYYRKHAVDFTSSDNSENYVGTTTLNFQCLCVDEIDPHNVILNFGADDCIPQIESPNYWYIMNKVSIVREDNGVAILATKGSASVSRDTWCWSFSLTVPESQVSKLVSATGDPVVLLINVNGYAMRMLYDEEPTREQTFASDYYTLTGRSPSALLDEENSPTRAFTQENERTSVQLMQAELDRAESAITLECELIDVTGWVIPTESFSYSDLSPIAAIQQIAESAGGFVYSSLDSEKLIIKPKYKNVYWDTLTSSDYDRIVPESIVTKISTKQKKYKDYNAVWLTNSKNGLTIRAYRSGTAADQQQKTTDNYLFTQESARYKAREILAKAHIVKNHSLTMPIESTIGLCLPGENLAYNGEWWGVVDEVSIDFSSSSTELTVNQTVTVERVNTDE